MSTSECERTLSALTFPESTDVALGSPADRPRVLHVITDSFSAHAFLKPLAAYLQEHGWDSVIACSPQSYDDAHSFTAEMRCQGLDVRDVAIRRQVDLIADVRQVTAVYRLIRHERPMLVHTHLAKGGVIGRVAARLAGVPCVHTVYDFAFVEHRGLRRYFYLGMELLNSPLARRILFVSENERQLALTARIGTPRQLTTIGFGIDLKEFNPTTISDDRVKAVKRRYGIHEGRLVVGTVARLVRRKGIDLLLEAAAHLLARNVNCHLLIAGGGPLQPELLTQVAELGLAGRVSLTGFVDDQSEMPSIFAAMDVFCLPSRREGYGMVYAEAGAMQRPVVAPNLPPIDAIVAHGETGLLVRPEDSVAFADAMERLLTNAPLRARMGERGARFVSENCDISHACARVLKVYTEVTGAPGPGLLEAPPLAQGGRASVACPREPQAGRLGRKPW